MLPELDLLDLWELVGDLELEGPGTASFAGRERFKALANVRELRADHIVRVAPGADQYELTVDAERGVLLRFVALLDGAPFELSEITGVAFDEDIAPVIFRLEEPPAGARHDRPQYPPSTCSFCGEEGTGSSWASLRASATSGGQVRRHHVDPSGLARLSPKGSGHRPRMATLLKGRRRGRCVPDDGVSEGRPRTARNAA